LYRRGRQSPGRKDPSGAETEGVTTSQAAEQPTLSRKGREKSEEAMQEKGIGIKKKKRPATFSAPQNPD